jgi:hypothetical protein
LQQNHRDQVQTIWFYSLVCEDNWGHWKTFFKMNFLLLFVKCWDTSLCKHDATCIRYVFNGFIRGFVHGYTIKVIFFVCNLNDVYLNMLRNDQKWKIHMIFFTLVFEFRVLLDFFQYFWVLHFGQIENDFSLKLAEPLDRKMYIFFSINHHHLTS